MTTSDSRDSVERVVDDIHRRLGESDAPVGRARIRSWADRLQALARGPQQAGGEDGDFLDDVCWQSWRDRAYKAEAEVTEIASSLPGVRFMDPPDGGSPSVAEQVRRMSEALETAEAALREAGRDAERYRWLRDTRNEDAVSSFISICNYGQEAYLLDGADLDAAIDAAMSYPSAPPVDASYPAAMRDSGEGRE